MFPFCVILKILGTMFASGKGKAQIIIKSLFYSTVLASGKGKAQTFFILLVAIELSSFLCCNKDIKYSVYCEKREDASLPSALLPQPLNWGSPEFGLVG